MFENFRTICYIPLIVFAIGWGMAQIMYLRWKRCMGNHEMVSTLQSICLKENTGILLAGMVRVILILVGIYFGIYARWMMIGVALILFLITIARTGATIEFSLKHAADGNAVWVKLAVVPLIMKLACGFLAGLWMIYVFSIAGL